MFSRRLVSLLKTCIIICLACLAIFNFYVHLPLSTTEYVAKQYLKCPSGDELEKIFQDRKKKLEKFCQTREESTQPLNWEKFKAFQNIKALKLVKSLHILPIGTLPYFFLLVAIGGRGF